MSNIPTTPLDDNDSIPESPFEQIKRIDPDGNEFWSARELMALFEYSSWQKFRNVLMKAQIACEKSGNDTNDHFMQATRIVSIGVDTKRKMEDIHLSRYACYLVVQNADPSKKTVALAQTYIAVQTQRKKIKKYQKNRDNMSSLELAAHFLRISMAEEKLRTQNIQGKENINQVHYEAGVVIRRAIAELGGTMPEDLPTSDSIKELERAQKKWLESGKKNDE